MLVSGRPGIKTVSPSPFILITSVLLPINLATPKLMDSTLFFPSHLRPGRKWSKVDVYYIGSDAIALGVPENCLWIVISVVFALP